MSLEMHCMKAVKTIKFHFFFRKIKGSSILHIKAVKFLGNFSRFFLVYKYTEGQEGGAEAPLLYPQGKIITSEFNSDTLSLYKLKVPSQNFNVMFTLRQKRKITFNPLSKFFKL